VPWAHPPPPAERPTPPNDGSGFMIGAGVLFVIGTLTTAAVGSCNTHGGWDDACLGGVLGAGGGILAAGGALMAIGAVKRGRFRAWQRLHPPPPRARLVLAPSLGGGLLLWSGSF
jgi:hypothetical protein